MSKEELLFFGKSIAKTVTVSLVTLQPAAPLVAGKMYHLCEHEVPVGLLLLFSHFQLLLPRLFFLKTFTRIVEISSWTVKRNIVIEYIMIQPILNLNIRIFFPKKAYIF